MKKLIAMIGAVATAFGLYAAGPFAISFESAESELGVDTGAMTFTPSGDWTYVEGQTLGLKAYAGETMPYGTGALARRDGSFRGEDSNYNYLTLETGTNTLTRASGYTYLDQLVKFTGFEEAQTNLAAGTKIAVWMSAIEQEGTAAVPGNGEPEFIDDLEKPLEEGGFEQKPNPDYFAGTPASADYVAGETNLYVTVGKTDDSGNVKQVALKVMGNCDPEAWYRLTIKSIGNIYGDSQETAARAGFVIFVNGVQVACDDAVAKTIVGYYGSEMTAQAAGYMAKGQLFPAIDNANATFATVGYQGIGAIDDIVLDDEGPLFAQSSNVDVTFAPLAEATVVKVVDGDGNEFTDFTSAISVKQGDLTVTLAAKPGWILRKTEFTVPANAAGELTVVLGEGDAVQAVALLNGTDYKAEDELYLSLIHI